MHPKDEQARIEILEHAQQLFKQFGLKKTTMDEIAVACGKAKSTLYHYFTSKEEVFEAVIDLERQNVRRMVKLAVDKEVTLPAKIKTYIVEFHREATKRANLYRIVSEQQWDLRQHRQAFESFIAFEKSYLIRLLEDSYDAGEFRDLDREQMGLFAEFMLASFCGTVKHIVESEGNFDLQKLEQLADIFSRKMFS